jgi:hypothetical protein
MDRSGLRDAATPQLGAPTSGAAQIIEDMGRVSAAGE